MGVMYSNSQGGWEWREFGEVIPFTKSLQIIGDIYTKINGLWGYLRIIPYKISLIKKLLGIFGI